MIRRAARNSARCSAGSPRRAAHAPSALLVLLLAALGLGAPAHAALTPAQREAVLAEAQAAYDRGVRELPTDREAARESFRDAALRFQQLADDGVVNGRLEYNLGNAYFQAGELGRAILHYRNAEKLIPGSAKLRHNLEYARSIRRDQIAPSGERALADALLAWHHRLALSTRLAVFTAAYAVFWIVLSVNLFLPRPAWRWLAVAAAVAIVAFGASVGADLLADGAAREGVLVRDDVTVRKANGEGFDPQFEEPLHQGVEFTVRDRRAGWIQIELPDGGTGWVREGDAELIG